MESLTAVYVANMFGIVLLCILLVCNWRRLREKTVESNSLLLMILFVFMGCLIDPFVCTADGQPGMLNKIIVLAGNSLLYIADMFSTFFWLVFMLNHLKVKLSLSHRYILQCALMLGVAIIIVNLFMPLVFDVSENNSYTRQAGYWLYCLIDYGMMIDSVVIYLICRHRGGPMKSFPIGICIAPVILGTVMQSMFYGISVISASFTIAIAGVIASLQSKRIYKDRATGAYNYAYLALLEKQYLATRAHNVSGIMINMNGFKKMNKDFGRTVANNALKNVATIIADTIGELGIVVRYTSDEFIAFVNTQDEMAVNMSIASIKSSFSDFNREPKNIYKISACFSTCKFDVRTSMDTFVDELSRRMHFEKMDFYAQGENNRRRR